MPDPIKAVVIVGGSLSGLMAAIVLRSQGFKVHVLERSSAHALQSQAAGIRAGHEVHEFITRYIKSPPEYAITLNTVDIVGKEGEVFSSFPSKEPMRLTTWQALYEMFLGTLLDEDREIEGQTAVYETQKLVTDVRLQDGKPTVVYTNLDDGTAKTIQADMVVGADGANSKVRNIMSPGIEPEYVGYVTWRGRVPEGAVRMETKEALENRVAVMRVEGGYVVSYYVSADLAPQDENPRKCDFVWIWYYTLPSTSPYFAAAMTDIDGRQHATTVPRGKVDPKIWQKILAQGKADLNHDFADLLSNTAEPFVSAIRDFSGRRAVFYEGRVVLVGDALALCRPHSGTSTSLAAAQCLLLARVLGGDLGLGAWEGACLDSIERAQRGSLVMGGFYFGGEVPPVVRDGVGNGAGSEVQCGK